MDFGEGRRGKRWKREREGRKVGERKKKCKWGQKEGEGKRMEREEGRRKEFCAVVIFPCIGKTLSRRAGVYR